MMLKAAPRPGHPVVAIGRVPGVAIGAAVGLPWHERLPIWPGPIVARQGRASIIVATHQGAVAIKPIRGALIPHVVCASVGGERRRRGRRRRG